MSEEILKETIQTFVEKLSIKVDAITIVTTPAHPLYSIETRDSKLLIGTDGENIRALNMLIKRMLEKKMGVDMPHFFIDVNGYHKQKLDELGHNAKMLAERVRVFKSNVEMSPMNAYDRMVVHATFTNDPDIETVSEGEGKFRHVVIKYKSNQE